MNPASIFIAITMGTNKDLLGEGNPWLAFLIS